MPYEIKKEKSGYKVCKKNEDKCFSKKPIPKINAIKQKYAIELHEASKTGGNYPEGFKKYSFIIRPKIGGRFIDCEPGWKTYPLTCQKDLECSFDGNEILKGRNPFKCNDAPKTKARPTDGRNDVEDWWWNVKKDLEDLYNQYLNPHCGEKFSRNPDLCRKDPEWEQVKKNIMDNGDKYAQWLKDHKLGIIVEEWDKYIYDPLRDTLFNKDWWTNVYRNMSLGDLLLLTLSVILPMGDVPGILLWGAIDTIKAISEGGSGIKQMGDLFISLSKLPPPLNIVAKQLFDKVEGSIESGFKVMNEANSKDLFLDMLDQLTKAQEMYPKERGDTSIPPPTKMMDLSAKIDHVKDLVNKLNILYDNYKANLISSPEAYAQAIEEDSIHLIDSAQLFSKETYHITVDLGKLKDPVLKQSIIDGYNKYRKENRPVAPVIGEGIKGKKFFEELKKYGIDPDDYLKNMKANAKKNKYDPKLVDWAYDDVHKLKYFSPEGVKKFGRVGYKDFFIYKHLEKNKEVEKGTAKMMRKRFHKSHEAMTKKYDLGVYSPNELSLKILW